MSLKRLSSWQAVAVMVPGALMVVFIAVGVVRSKASSWRAMGPPEAATVASYGVSPARFGDSCGGVAVVKLKDGELVRAAATADTYLRDGTTVTVIERRSTCPPALYTVLHDGPPSRSSSRHAAPSPGTRTG